MLPFVISTQAETDAEDAGKWYDKRKLGLSHRFYDEIKEYLLKIQNNPNSFSVRKQSSDTRKCSLKKFPYNIFYIIENKHIP